MTGGCIFQLRSYNVAGLTPHHSTFYLNKAKWEKSGQDGTHAFYLPCRSDWQDAHWRAHPPGNEKVPISLWWGHCEASARKKTISQLCMVCLSPSMSEGPWSIHRLCLDPEGHTSARGRGAWEGLVPGERGRVSTEAWVGMEEVGRGPRGGCFLNKFTHPAALSVPETLRQPTSHLEQTTPALPLTSFY